MKPTGFISRLCEWFFELFRKNKWLLPFCFSRFIILFFYDFFDDFFHLQKIKTIISWQWIFDGTFCFIYTMDCILVIGSFFICSKNNDSSILILLNIKSLQKTKKVPHGGRLFQKSNDGFSNFTSGPKKLKKIIMGP